MLMVLLWVVAALMFTSGIAIDMRCLGLRGLHIRARTWFLLSVAVGPISVVIYMCKRQSLRRRLMDAAWRLIGNEEFSVEVRRARLVTLRHTGLIGPAIYKACLQVLEQ